MNLNVRSAEVYILYMVSVISFVHHPLAALTTSQAGYANGTDFFLQTSILSN